MSTFTWSGDPNDPMLNCPYAGMTHRIIASRMMRHLVRCQENFKDDEIGICCFNSTHRLPKSKIMSHLESCPDKEKVLRQIVKTYDEALVINDDYIVPEIPESSDSWDDCNAPTYDPQLKVANEPILRSLNVASKKKRKQFRLQQRLEFALNSGTIPKNSAGSGHVADDDDYYAYNHYSASRAVYAHPSIGTSAGTSNENAGASIASSSMGPSEIVKEEEECKVVKGKTKKQKAQHPALPKDAEISGASVASSSMGPSEIVKEEEEFKVVKGKTKKQKAQHPALPKDAEISGASVASSSMVPSEIVKEEEECKVVKGKTKKQKAQHPALPKDAEISGASVASSSMGPSEIVKEEECKVVKWKTKKQKAQHPALPKDAEISGAFVASSSMGPSEIVKEEEEFKVVKGKTKKQKAQHPALPKDAEISENLARPASRGPGRLRLNA